MFLNWNKIPCITWKIYLFAFFVLSVRLLKFSPTGHIFSYLSRPQFQLELPIYCCPRNQSAGVSPYKWGPPSRPGHCQIHSSLNSGKSFPTDISKDIYHVKLLVASLQKILNLPNSKVLPTSIDADHKDQAARHSTGKTRICLLLFTYCHATKLGKHLFFVSEGELP